MIGAKLAKGVENLRAAIEEAEAEGAELPAVEAGFTVEFQNQIRKKLGDLPANLITGLQEKIEALQEATDDVDEALDILTALGLGAEASIKLEQRLAEDADPEIEVVDVERIENDGGHKVRGD